jgi:hypothetical protein
MSLSPKVILVILAIILAALSYIYQPLLGASVILLAVSHFIP